MANGEHTTKDLVRFSVTYTSGLTVQTIYPVTTESFLTIETPTIFCLSTNLVRQPTPSLPRYRVFLSHAPVESRACF